MAAFRWVFRGNGKTWTVPINPAEMGSLFPEKNVTVKNTTAGKALMFEGARPPTSWEFSGDILDDTHYEALRYWVYDVPGRISITDHYGRVIECVLTSFQAVPKRDHRRKWRHTYTVRGLVLRVGAPAGVA